MSGETILWLTAALFTLTYLALALGRVPGLRIDRAGIAMVGATLMLVTGLVSFEQAVSPESIDYKTLALLFGMMVVVGFLRLSGLLERLSRRLMDRIRTPRGLLAVTITISGVLSAFLINDIVCLALTPLVLHLARRLRFDPVPHLIALATAANIGSTVGLFFTGLPLELVALGAAALLLLSRIKPEHVYRQIDWSLLVMFFGLFVVVHAFQIHVVSHWEIEHWNSLLSRPVGLLSLVATLLSNVVSNVPAVLLMEPLLKAIPAGLRENAWLALAMSSTLAGNLTVLGSVANLIVLENGRREGVRVSFWEYSKVGVPLTILTMAIGIAWLEFVRY